MELLLALKQLYIMLLGLAVMIGLLSPGQALRRIAHMLVVPLVVLLVWSFAAALWAGLTPKERFYLIALIAVLLPIGGLMLLARTRFGREVLASLVGNALYDLLRWSLRRLPWLLLLTTGGLLLCWLWR